MYEPKRHIPLRPDPWDPAVAQAAIREIVDDALGRYRPDRFWPAHPMDDGLDDGASGLYFGATGVIWALDHLHRTGVVDSARDFRPDLASLLAASRTETAAYGNYARHASLLMAEVGSLLLTMRLDPSPATADLLHRRMRDNLDLPVLELMWGTPGTMLAARFMHDMTGEARWREAYREQARRLLADLEDGELGPIWTQNLYGRTARYLGPVHGFAGNMLALLRGWDWLEDDERSRIAAAIVQTLAATAWDSEMGVTWHALATRETPPDLVQHCHGAPGMVTVFADAPVRTPELDRLLRRAGDLVWAAGPLAKGANLCHGTGGNGYAFLKLHRRLGEPVWLERARAFAMTAIAQCREDRARHGRGRYSLWTGDVGLAIYLRDCISGEPGFPTTEVF